MSTTVASEGTPLVSAQVYGKEKAGTTIAVTAPSDLLGGYQFYVDSSEIKYILVEVPAGGVKAGQVFRATVLSEAFGGGHKVPYGQWRDSICNCFAFGCCHPQCCLTLWFAPCALGQILSRMKLDWRGKETTGGQARSPFVVWFSLLTAYYIVTCCLSTIISMINGDDDLVGVAELNVGDLLVNGTVPENAPETPDDNDNEEAAPPGMWVLGLQGALNLIGFVFGLLVLIITIRTRYYIRKKYGIPERRCHGCEDCCCSFWCSPCAVCQMARHTGNYWEYPAACCSEKGFASGAPEVV